MIKSYGTGIRRIYNLYADCSAQPQIEVTFHTFKFVLPNMNAASSASPDNAATISLQMQKILDYIKANGQITEKENSKLLGLKKTRTFTIAKQMRDLELIKAVGRDEGKYYTII